MSAVNRLTHLAELCLPRNGSIAGPGTWPLRDSVEWDQLLHVAERAGVFPAVFQRLRQSGSSFAALEGSHWERHSRSILARNLVLRQTQDKLLAALESAGLPCQPIKGVRLAQRLYGELGWRESFDVDLICPADEVPAVYATLKKLGLRDVTSAWTEAGFRRALSQPGFMFPEIKLTAANGTLVELHWDWTGETFPESDPLHDAEAYAVYLCRHAAKHFWSSLQWLCDIEMLLRDCRDRFDWPRFWMLAGRANAVRDCAASLEICGELFASPFARQVSPHHRKAARKLAWKAIEALADPEGREETRAHPARRLLQVDGWNRRMRRCWHWLAPAPRCFNQAGPASVAAVWAARYSRLALDVVWSSPSLARWRRSLAKASVLKLSDWVEIARAGLLLTQARWALASHSLTEVARWATHGIAHSQSDTVEIRETVYRLEKAVRRAARLHPVQMKCLPRALALTKMLAARGIAIDLKLGVRREAGRFAGHAWVEWNGEVVNESAAVSASYAALAHSLDRGGEGFDVASA